MSRRRKGTRFVRIVLDFVYVLGDEVDSLPNPSFGQIAYLAAIGARGVYGRLKKMGIREVRRVHINERLDYRPMPAKSRDVVERRRRRHSASSQVKCEICSPLRCSKAQ